VTDQETVPVSEPARTEPARARWATSARVGVTLAVSGAALGAVAGWLWYVWWAPARPGVIFETADGPRWFPSPWDPGQAQVFAGTATFALTGIGVGLLLGVLAVLVGRRQPYAALVSLLIGTAIAAAVAYLVGTRLSPPDPQSLVDTEPVGTELAASIHVSGWTPYLCWPLGGLLGYLAATFLVSALDDVRRRDADPGGRLHRRPADEDERPAPQ
jgi:hypothetical protein